MREQFFCICFWQAFEYQPKYRIISNEKQLNGIKRFLSDGLATNKQCQLLLNLAKLFAIVGDGYEGKKPPSIEEQFTGFTLTRAILLTYYGFINKNYLQLYLDLTENVREKIIDYFQLNNDLEISFSHLVCRRAFKGVYKFKWFAIVNIFWYYFRCKTNQKRF